VKLDIETLILNHFKSFTDRTVIALDGRPGVYFTRGINEVHPRLGANGVGKTTLWDGISWCWYGRTPSGLRGTDVKPWRSRDHAKVSTTIRVGGKLHDIERSTASVLLLDGRDVGQETITNLLGLDFDTFCQTILLAQGEGLFLDKPPAEKLAMFSTVLNLHRWEDRSEEASQRTRDLDNRSAKVRGEIEALATSCDSLDKLIDDTRNRQKVWSHDQAKKIEDLDARIKETSKNVESIRQKYEAHALAYDGLMLKAKEVAPDLQAAFDKRDKAVRELAIVQGQIEACKHEYDALTRALDAKDRYCPTCGQRMHAQSLQQAKDRVKELMADIEHGVPEHISEDVEVAEAAVAKLRLELLDRNRKADEARLPIDRLAPMLGQAKAELKNFEQAHEIALKEENPHRLHIKDLQRRLAQEEEDLKDAKREVEEIAVEIEHTRYWIKGFKDVELFIIEGILHELEIVTEDYLDQIGLIGWKMRYDVEKEGKTGKVKRGINVTILSPHNDNWVRWESWSGGESQRLRLANALALSEILLDHAGVEPLFEILDEPAHFMSDEGIEDMCAFLIDRARHIGRRTFYTDHQMVENSRFEDVITIRRTKQGSTVS
jgi:DNA repair exonuclease SbcCD ATPase subunit